jgi:N-acetylneuraminic acid mutarotase
MIRAAVLGGAGLAGVAVVGCASKGESPQVTSGPAPTSTQVPPVQLVTPEPGLARIGWVQLKPPGEIPSARVQHSLVWNEADGQVYLFGGRSAGTPLGDLWTFNVDDPAWTQVQTEGPSPGARFGHRAVFDPAGGRILVLGGQVAETFLDDLWAFTSRDNTWSRIAVVGTPPARQGAGVALDTDSGRLYVTHGVGNQGYLDDTWVLDLASATWEEISAPAGGPSKRGLLRAVWYPSGERLMIFGGESSEQPLLGDLWSFDPTSRSWEELPQGEPSPEPRKQYGALYASDRDWMLMYGGASEGTDLNDLWFYVLAQKGWGYASSYGTDPGGRSGHDLAFVPRRASTILFGGVKMGQEMQDVWEVGLGRPQV